MQLHIYNNPDELSQAVANWMADYIQSVLLRSDRFTIALSGGSTPQKLHTILAATPYREKIDWARIHFFWGDERAVPFTDDRNNAKMAYDTLLDNLSIPAEHIHVMRTDIDPQASAAEYEKILHRYFDETSNSFDLVLLGMGDDGHTLSLFPGTEIVHEQTAWAKAFFLQAQGMYRISLTAPIVNKAASVVFLVAGKNKSETLKLVLEGPFQPDLYPSQIIKPDMGELHWFIDEAASADLKKV
ncbi:MAG: 6-phosphogluconolactonase [Chitinophagaceae bacterium]